MSDNQEYVPRPRVGQGNAVTVIVAVMLILALLAVLVFGGMLYLKFAHSVELQRALEAEQRARVAAEVSRAVAEQARLEAELARQNAQSGEPISTEIQPDP